MIKAKIVAIHCVFIAKVIVEMKGRRIFGNILLLGLYTTCEVLYYLKLDTKMCILNPRVFTKIILRGCMTNKSIEEIK